MRIRRLTTSVTSLLLALAAANVSAQSTYYWNPTGSTDEQGGDGTIDTTTPLWNTSSTPSATLAVLTSGKHAVFGGTGGTITSNNASLTTGNVTFKDTAYTLVGDLNLSITGNLIAEQFGSLTVKDTLTINADLALYYGTLNVDGGSFSTTTHGYIGVNSSSNGRLNISNGGSASFVNNSVGTFASSYGFITVDGEESTLTNSGNIYIGQSGYGQLTISNGAKATAYNAYLGYTLGANGSVTVTGDNSTFTVTNFLKVGNDESGAAAGRGSLIVADDLIPAYRPR
jgi:fibronectin-binding autotransporter adhesin